MYQQFIKNKMKANLVENMMNIQNFEEMREELYQEPIYKNQKTLCFDIQNIFLSKVIPQDLT